MRQQKLARHARIAGYAALLSQLRQPGDLAKLTLLILVWAHVRTRAGYNTHGEPPVPRAARNRLDSRKRGIKLPRRRTRFL